MSLSAITNRRLCDLPATEATIKIALLRHAKAATDGRFCGHSDPGLSAEGQEQLAAVVSGMSQFVPRAIWSSDLRRARQTAAPIARKFALDYATSSAFREMNFGLWEGLSWPEVEHQYPDDAQAWQTLFPRHRAPQGESFAELQARAATQLELLAEAADPGYTLVVTHAGFIRAAVTWVLAMPEERISHLGQSHGALTILEKIGNHWSLSAFNLALSCWRGARREKVEDQE